MKRSHIKKGVSYCEITINSDEAKRILHDLDFLSGFLTLKPETISFKKYLEDLIKR